MNLDNCLCTVANYISPHASVNIIGNNVKTKSIKTITSQPNFSKVTLLSDSGCTDVLLTESDANKFPNLTNKGGHCVNVANNQQICSIGSGKINLHKNLKVDAHIFKDTDLARSLLSNSSITNQGFHIGYDIDKVSISKHGEEILSGTKLPHEKLWSIDINTVNTSSSSPSDMPQNQYYDNFDTAYLAVKNTSHAEQVKYLSATLGNPADSTLYIALREKWLIYPFIDHLMILNNPPHSIETDKGHLDLNRAGVQSTKRKPSRKRNRSNKPCPSPNAPLSDSDKFLKECESVSNIIYSDSDENAIFSKAIAHDMHSVFLDDPRQYSDATGRFPITSYRGFQYILISVYKGYIHFTPMRGRSAEDYLEAFRETILYFSRYGKCPLIVRLDNETSKIVEDFFTNVAEIKYEYVSPHNHRTNNAERSIRTAKNHIIATLAGCPPLFPANRWCALLPQAEISLNHMRPWASDRKKSAWFGLHQYMYDFAAHPLAPPGIRILAYDSAATRGTWADHGSEGFYLGPALQHYRNYNVYIISTRSNRITDSVSWYSDKIIFPGASLGDRLLASINDLTSSLKDICQSTEIPQHHRISFDQHTGTAVAALRWVYDMMHATPLPPAPPAILPTPAPQQPHPIAQVVPNNPQPHPAHQIQRVVESALNLQVNPTPPPNIPIIAIVQHAQPVQGVETRAAVRHRIAGLAPDSALSASNEFSLPFMTRPINTISDFLHSNHNAMDSPFNIPSLSSQAYHALFVENSIAPSSAASHTTRKGPPTNRLNLDVHGKPLKYNAAMKDPDRVEDFTIASSNEWRKLLDQRSCMEAIYFNDIPLDRRPDITYYNPVCKEKVLPNNVYQARVRGTLGGDRTNYPGHVSSHVAAMPAIKILLNAVVSEDANFMTIDIKDYFIMHALDRPEFVRVPLRSIPNDIRKEFDLDKYSIKGHVYFRASKTIYGLPQAGLLSEVSLIKLLRNNDYIQCPNTPMLFRHKTRNIAFSLVVDDFGVKYKNKIDADHLVSILTSVYDIATNWEGTKYLGYEIYHDKVNRELILSMPNIIPRALKRFCPDGPPKPASSPGIYVPPNYGQEGQKFAKDDISPLLSPADTLYIQEVNGVLLYYAIALDCTFLQACATIATTSAKPTQNTMDEVHRLLAYAHSNSNSQLVFHASGMILKAQSDSSYLTRPGAKSVAGGIWYLGGDDPTIINGAIDVLSKTLDVVTASAGESEYGSLFIVGQRSCPHRNALEDLGYPQPATQIIVDNAFAKGLANDEIKAKRSKAIDMRFHWIRDRVRQGQFEVIWKPGKDNLADFFTKAQPVWRHKEFMPKLIRTPPSHSSPGTACHSIHHTNCLFTRIHNSLYVKYNMP